MKPLIELSLAQKFVRNHDMKVKDEIERLAREYGKLKEPWVLWRGERARPKAPCISSEL
jgi:hypothetical protein